MEACLLDGLPPPRIFKGILRHNERCKMKITSQLIATGVLLSTACLLLVIWVVTLCKDAAIISMLCRSRFTPNPPLQQPQNHHELVVKPVFTTIHNYDYIRDMNRRYIGKLFVDHRTEIQRTPVEISEEFGMHMETCDVNPQKALLARERFRQQLKKQKQMRFLDAKQKLFDMNLLTPEEWGQFVTGHDPISMQIEELLESRSELMPQDYEEINGKVKATRKTAEILRKMQEEIERDIAEKEAERIAAAQMRTACDGSVMEH